MAEGKKSKTWVLVFPICFAILALLRFINPAKVDVAKTESIEQMAQKNATAKEEPTVDIDAIAQRIKDNKENLKTHYATQSMLSAANDDIKALDSSDSKRTAKIRPSLEEQRREIYASILTEGAMDKGTGTHATAVGKDKKTLRIEWALMSESLAYRTQKEGVISENANMLGFNKIIYTNGFRSSLGSSWSYDLK